MPGRYTAPENLIRTMPKQYRSTGLHAGWESGAQAGIEMLGGIRGSVSRGVRPRNGAVGGTTAQRPCSPALH